MISGKVKVSAGVQDHFPALVKRYVSEPSSIAELFAEPCSLQGIVNTAKSMSFPVPARRTLVDALLRQNGSINLHPSSLTNIHALHEATTFTVCTGQQLCLLGGPLYTTLKILSVIRLTEELNRQECGLKFVPLFWMHSEDHDLEEISGINLFEKEIRWKTGQEGPAGKLSLQDIHPFVEELTSAFGQAPYAERLREIIARAYDAESDLATATRSFINELFGKYGLVILDPDDKRLKQLFIPVIREELVSRSGFRIVSKTNEHLKELGFEPQARPREINLFDLNGKRERIQDGTPYLEEVDERPERFSPNVILRSVYQQLILPNAAYVGGPAEIAYWLQYKELLAHFQVAFPVLVPRNSVFIVEERSAQHMAEMGFSPADFIRPLEALEREYLSKTGNNADLHEELAGLESLIGQLEIKASNADPALAAHVRSEGMKMQKILEGIRQKMQRAIKKREEVSLSRMRNIHAKLFPGGIPQERVGSFLPYYLTSGNAFFDNLKDQFEAIPADVLVLLNKN